MNELLRAIESSKQAYKASGLMYAHDWLASDFKEFIEADDKKDS